MRQTPQLQCTLDKIFDTMSEEEEEGARNRFDGQLTARIEIYNYAVKTVNMKVFLIVFIFVSHYQLVW